jgi:amino acid adenylation domain-containing protein
MLVQDFLVQSAQRRPEQVGLVCAGRRFTFRELDQMSNQIARALVAQGVARGERVALYLPNCVEAVAGIFGVLKAGAVFVMVNPTTKREKLDYLLKDSGAAAILADSALWSHSAPTDIRGFKALILRERAGGTISPAPSGLGATTFAEVFAKQPRDPLPPQNTESDLACLIYTSGSTGEAKGVMCGHGNVTFATQSIIEYLANNESDVVLSVLPLSFSYGLYQLMAAMGCGGRLVLEESFAFPAAILKKMAAERVTGFAGVPTVYAILLGLDLSTFDLSSLRYLTNAAAALPLEHVRRVRERFPKVALFLMHGLTEVVRTVYLPPEQVDTRPASVGHAIPRTEVWLEDETGRRVGPGEMGEMVVRGRHVMQGYWNNPEATRARFREGSVPGERICYSGDLFRTDAEGYLYFVARKDDIIKCRGEKVSPREVENVLYTLEGVTEAAVIGVPDPVLGQAIKAFVVAPGRQLTSQQVMAHCKAHLEDLMIPKFVEFRDALPKTPSGKIRKVELS